MMQSPSSRPKAGDVVVITVPNYSPVLRHLFPNTPDKVTYEGTVLPGDTWLLGHEFNVSSDNKQFPIRTFSLQTPGIEIKVVGRNDKLPYFREAQLRHGIRTFPVTGSKGDVYTVTISHDRKAICSCTGFSFRGKCGHIPKDIDQFMAEQPENTPFIPDPNRGEQKRGKKDRPLDIGSPPPMDNTQEDPVVVSTLTVNTDGSATVKVRAPVAKADAAAAPAEVTDQSKAPIKSKRELKAEAKAAKTAEKQRASDEKADTAADEAGPTRGRSKSKRTAAKKADTAKPARAPKAVKKAAAKPKQGKQTKAGSKMEKCIAIIGQHGKTLDRQGYLKKFMQAGCTQAGAGTYYSLLKDRIK